MKKVKIALAVSFGLGVSPASAQYYDGVFWIGQTGGMHTILNHQILAEHIKRGGGKDGPSASVAVSSPAAAPASSASFFYSPSLQRRRGNYARFVEQSRRADPAGAEGLAANLALDPVALMEPELATVGLRIDDVADAYAVYWVEAWQAVHGVSGDTSRATAQAVRAQAARAIAAMPAFASATAAQKQEFAESYLVQAVLVGAAKEQSKDDPGKLAQVSAAVEKGARAAGLDLRAMTLTEEGFRPAG